jgi:radical SAM/Cys-rich protein
MNDVSLDFQFYLQKHNLKLSPISVETVWVNITRLCNQACRHCHVDASPNRAEQMNRDTIDRCLEIIERHEYFRNVDITGGAPELNPNFDYFVIEARKLKRHVIVRHNLTVTFDGDPQTSAQKDYLPEFFAKHEVEILASFPHYEEHITDGQRGKGVFSKSIEGMRQLNRQGYGKDGTGLTLNLVHNCDGPLSPVGRTKLESEFREALRSRYGLIFNRLYCVTNMPINRYCTQLDQTGGYDRYIERLANTFSPEAARQVVCRSLISIGYDGRIYDCDFNQMLNLQIHQPEPATIFDFDLDALRNRSILFGPHCFGCTAGGGSS